MSFYNRLTPVVLQRPLELAQYLSIRYIQRLAEPGMEPSVGSVGDSYDNALAESVIGLFKTEVIRRRGPWRGLDDVEFATLDWVSWYNTQRLLEPIGYVPPVEYEDHLVLPVAQEAGRGATKCCSRRPSRSCSPPAARRA